MSPSGAHIQALFPEATVKGFDRRVVGRLPTSAEIPNDGVGVRPQIHRGTDEFAAVVAVDPLWQAALVT